MTLVWWPGSEKRSNVKGLWSQTAWIQILALPLPDHVIQGGFLVASVTLFPCL